MEILTQSPENSAQIGLAPNSDLNCVEEVGEAGKDVESGSVERNSSKGGLYPVQPPPSPQQQPLAPAEGRKIAFLIPCIVALNVGMFMVTMYTNDCPKTIPNNHKCFAKFLQRFSFQPLSENPLLGPSSQTLELLGALDAHKVTNDHQGWRLITCIWLHAGVVHVLANMLSLLFVGIRLEQEFRFVRIGIIYFLSGYGGSLLSALFIQNRISVGASGALFGLLGAMLSEIIMNWTIYTNKCATITTLMLVVAVNLAVGILPHVDNFAHIGGFVVGFLSGFVLLVKPQFGWVNRASLPPGYDMQSLTKAKHQGRQYALWVMALVFLIAGIVTVTILVFRGVYANKECTWCHYLSCVPTSKWKCDDSSSSLSCSTSQVGNNWQLTCVSNNKTTLAALNQSNAVLQEICTQLCS